MEQRKNEEHAICLSESGITSLLDVSNRNMFTYTKCKNWLELNGEKVATSGYKTTMSENETHPVTVRLRFEGQKAMGEIVVWESEATSMMLYDLQLEKYVIDQHDLVLVDDRYDKLADFFEAALTLK